MESRDLVSVSRHVSRPVFSSLDHGLEGLRSRLGLEGFWSRSRGLRLETLHELFFMKSCKKQLHKKRIYKINLVQNSAVQSGQWMCFLCCNAAMEKTICPLPCLKFVLNSIKTVCVPVKPQHIISATLTTRRWEYFAKECLSTVLQAVLLWKPYSKDVRECQQVSVIRSQTKRGLFFEVLFKAVSKNTLVSFFVLRNADFVKFRNASELSWEKVLLIRVLYREQVMRHGWSATVTCC